MAKAVGYFLDHHGMPNGQALTAAIFDCAGINNVSVVGIFNDAVSDNISLNRKGLINCLIMMRKLGAEYMIISKASDLFSNRTDSRFLADNAFNISRSLIKLRIAEMADFASEAEGGREKIESLITDLSDLAVPAYVHQSKTIGTVDYLEILRMCHSILNPDIYVEIGVKYGKSISLSKCRAIGIDPYPRVKEIATNPRAEIHPLSSDDFFANERLHKVIAPGTIDLAFIDGMHLFDFALRDFINIEKNSHSRTVVAIDDIYPRNALEALPDWLVMPWAGDVWKLILCLRRYRPELEIIVTDAHPTGIALIGGLDSSNTTLHNRYDEILEYFNGIDYIPIGDIRNHVISSFPSDSPYIERFLKKKLDINQKQKI